MADNSDLAKDNHGTRYHVPVLYHETIASLNINSSGIYVDGTVGGGGHAYGVVSQLSDCGKLIGFDQDPAAIVEATKRFADLDSKIRDNITLVNANFADMDIELDKLGIDLVDGVLLDIGVSSHQLDNAQRGFSFHHDAPLDMRMGEGSLTAGEMVNTYDEKVLADIFFAFGEEKYSRSIAKSIIKHRAENSIETTLQLAEIIKNSVPMAYRRSGHPARKVFQALRIAVNDELSVLEKVLEIAFNRLKVGGRFSVITFHSLEDRMVKKYFVKLATGCECPPKMPMCVCGKLPRGRMVNKKPIIASEQEINRNPRSRSAKLRTIEKL